MILLKLFKKKFLFLALLVLLLVYIIISTQNPSIKHSVINIEKSKNKLVKVNNNLDKPIDKISTNSILNEKSKLITNVSLTSTQVIFNDKFFQKRFNRYIQIKEPFLNDKNEIIEFSKYKQVLKSERNRNNLRKKYYSILEYTKVWGSDRYCHTKMPQYAIEEFQNDENFNKLFNFNLKSNKEYNYLEKCVYKNCFFTCKKQYEDEVDAIMFHKPEMEKLVNDYPENYQKLWKKRNPEQIWIVYNDEPYRTHENFDKMNFNLTLSYVTQADASFGTYGIYVGKTPEKNMTFEAYKKIIEKEFNSRSNTILWFVSNCNSKKRLEFTAELAKHYPIGVGGRCKDTVSKLANEKHNASLKALEKCGRNTDCELKMLTSHKYYLAFESLNCTDYITEKFWRTLKFGSIPIVYRPPKDSYLRVAPADSFIHAQDFNFDTKKLADYLNLVNNDFNLYLKHRKWQYNNYAIYDAEGLEPFRLCELCTKLNSDTSKYFYNSVSKFFNSKCETYDYY